MTLESVVEGGSCRRGLFRQAFASPMRWAVACKNFADGSLHMLQCVFVCLSVCVLLLPSISLYSLVCLRAYLVTRFCW
jgi:hypothetical protein